MNELEEQVRSLVEPVLARHGADLVDLQVKRGRTQLVRVVADTPQGIDIDTCARISDDLGRMLDLQDPIVGPYTLEVTSPGLDRPLRSPADFEKVRGKPVKVVLEDRQAEGIVEEVGNESVTLLVRPPSRRPGRPKEGQRVEIRLEEIRRATLVLPW